MSRSGCAPWEDDIAADWFINLMEKTGLPDCAAATLQQPFFGDDGDCVTASEIRAASFLLICLGRTSIWPTSRKVEQLELSINKMESCIDIEEDERVKDVMRLELQMLTLLRDRDIEKQRNLFGTLWLKWLNG